MTLDEKEREIGNRLINAFDNGELDEFPELKKIIGIEVEKRRASPKT